jgi:hypothetical protein
LASSPLYE